MTRFPCAETLFLRTRPMTPIHPNMPLSDLLYPDPVEVELAGGRMRDSCRVLATAAGLNELPQNIPVWTGVRTN